jgi:hypothetical protein
MMIIIALIGDDDYDDIGTTHLLAKLSGHCSAWLPSGFPGRLLLLLPVPLDLKVPSTVVGMHSSLTSVELKLLFGELRSLSVYIDKQTIWFIQFL